MPEPPDGEFGFLADEPREIPSFVAPGPGPFAQELGPFRNDVLEPFAAPVDDPPIAVSPDAATPPDVPTRSKSREIVFVTLAAAVSGIVTLGVLIARTSPAAEVAAAAVTATPRPATPVSASIHRWTAANGATWIGDSKNAVAFELESDDTVGVWMRTVRPVLVVRCIAGAIEAFVFTSSAARIEPLTSDHTVRVSFDDGGDLTERWGDSEEHDALFAPDGAAFVRQLLNARVVRFGFTPHNATPVTARFNVAGLAGFMEPATRQCGATR